MAKKNQVYIDIIIDDDGTTKRVAVNAKKLGIELEKATTKAGKGTDNLSKSQKTLDRNMRGTAKMSSNTTKEFSKMSQGMGGLVGAYATLAAQVFAVSAAFQFLQGASDLRNLIGGQEALGASTGVVYKSITSNLIRATDAQLKYTDAAKAAAIGTAAGLSSRQLTDLSAAAKNASFALGRDLTDSFNRLIRGVTKAEPELLDELGIILRLEPATKKYAASIGKTTSELTAFERTQAVSNEVLEQAARKFGRLEGMMDPSAATLAQFTKSFDELVNTFKIGLLNFVTPGLKFLAENTVGLVGALSLVALPIIKAILPSMDAWILKTKEIQVAQREAADVRIAALKKEDLAVRNSMRTNQEKLLSDQAAARGVVQNTGANPKGAAMQFMTGGKETARGQQASESMLAKAREELDVVVGERTTALKHMQEEELDILQESHQQRMRTNRDGTNAIVNSQRTIVSASTRAARMVNGAWTKAFNGVVAVARGAAIAINFAFKAIAFVGFALLAIDLVKQLGLVMNPLTEAQKEEKKVVDDLAASYEKLGQELKAGREFRNRETGGQQVLSLGAAFQGADVAKVIQDINRLNKSADKNSEGFRLAQKRLAGTVKQVALLAPGFNDLSVAMTNGTIITNKQATAMRGLAAGYVAAGQAARKYQQDQKDLDSFMTSLGEDAAQVSPLNDAKKAAGDSYDGAKKKINDLRLASVPLQTAVDNGEMTVKTFTDLQNEADKLKKQGILSDAYFERQENAEGLTGQIGAQFTNLLEMRNKQWGRAERDEEGDLMVRGSAEETVIQRTKDYNGLLAQMEAFRERGAALSEEDLELAKQTLEANREILVEEKKKAAEYDATHKMLTLREGVRLQHAIDMIKHATTDAKQRTRGLTIGSKQTNIELDRVKALDAVQKARNSLATKEAMEVDAVKRAEKKGIEQAKENTRIANLRLELAIALQESGDVVLQDKEAQLAIDKASLSINRASFALTRQIVALENSSKLNKAIGGGTRASQTSGRADQVALLEMERDRQSQQNEILRRRYRKTLDQARLDNKNLPEEKRETPEFVDFQASQSKEGLSFRAGRNKEVGYQNELDILAQMPQKVRNINDAKIEGLRLDQQGVFLLGEKGVLHDLERAFFKDVKREANEEEMAFLTAQAEAIWQLSENTRMQQEIVNTISSNMSNAFISIVQGTQSAKEAFKQMALSIISDIAAMIIKALIFKALTAAFGGLFGGGGGAVQKGIPLDSMAPLGGGSYNLDGSIMPAAFEFARHGGVFEKKGYRGGGIAEGRDAGYPAMLHGTEAVVPIGMNRKIPVEMVNGGAGQNNNVTVNVAMDSSGNGKTTSTQDNGAQGAKMGALIASAVQKELQYQKRSGGILNPYGVA